MGIEPTAQAWEAWVLPLYDARVLSQILVAFRKIRQIFEEAGALEGTRFRSCLLTWFRSGN